MVKYCEKCGNELKNENVKFCDKCGAEVRINENNSKPIINGVICRYCGQTIPMGQNICENCGMPLEDDNKTAVIIGYIVTWVLGFIGLIPAIYLLTRNSNKSKTQGIILLAMSILWIFNRLLYSASLMIIIIIIILTIVGVYLWLNDINIIN